MSRSRKSRRRGLTLLEVLLAIGLIVLVSSMMFAFYDVTLQSRETAQKMVSSGFLARTIAHQIADEIRAANGFLATGGPGVSGTERRISIQTVRFPDRKLFRRLSIDDQPPAAECDVRQVQYYIAYDDEEQCEYPDGTMGDCNLGLVRREVKTLFQTPGAFAEEAATDGANPFAPEVDLDLISSELKYFRVRYFDGVDMIDRWDIATEPEAGMGNSLPQAVEITVGYNPPLLPPEEDEAEKDQQEEELADTDLLPSVPEPYSRETYTVTVRLPQADAFFGSRMMRAQRRSRMGADSGAR